MRFHLVRSFFQPVSIFFHTNWRAEMRITRRIHFCDYAGQARQDRIHKRNEIINMVFVLKLNNM